MVASIDPTVRGSVLATVKGRSGEGMGEAGAPEQQVFVGIFKHLTRTKGN